MFKLFKRKAPPAPEPTDTFGYLTRHYSTHDEDVRLTTQRGKVEFLTTMRYIERYLEPDMRVLEIGAGTGRYSLTLARMGYDVTAIELVQHNIDIFKKKLRPGDKVDLQQGNALDLSRFADGTFDMTLLFGPMYHLYTAEDQTRALEEALRVTKPGGLLYVAYCISDMSLHYHGFIKGHIEYLIAKGMADTETFACHSKPKDLFQLMRREDIDALIAPLPCQRLHYVASDGPVELMAGAINKMTPARFELYMKYRFAICEREDMAGATNHSLDILRKDEI
jgi:ubiquinone/menaquinone biosynthesis C-methylase UbiE